MRVNGKVALVSILISAASGSALAAKQPVYIYAFSRFGDFVNIDMTENRLRDTVTAVEAARQKFPDTKLTLTVLLSGALSQALNDRNSKTHIKDYLLDARSRGVIEIGYDGTDEPTYQIRPYADLSRAKTGEERWRLRAETMEKFLTEARDPKDGRVIPGKSGGLKAMQEVFGEAVCIKSVSDEVGGDSEYVHRIRRYNTKAIMWGLLDRDPSTVIHGYRGSVREFGKDMSPLPESSPELNWIDNVLRTAESSDAAIRNVPANEGPAAVQKIVGAIDRGRVHIIHLELGPARMYLSNIYASEPLYPPMKLAYDHPDNPKLPPEAFPSSDKLEAARANQRATLEWLAREFFHADPGSRFVSSTDLMQMTQPAMPKSVSVAELEASLSNVVKEWGTDTYLPSFITVGKQYLSLTDTFTAMANILAEQHRTGKRPQIVPVRRIYGPIETPDEHGPAVGEVQASSVANLCTDLVSRLNDDSWKPMPSNIVPAWFDVNGHRVTAGQFFRLMAEAVAERSLDRTLKLKMTYNHSNEGLEYPKTRTVEDQGGTWTFRPAPLRIEPMVQANSR